MNKKIINFLGLFIVFFIVFFININDVKALKCIGAKNQCNWCTYSDASTGEEVFTYYAQADGKGSISVSGVGLKDFSIANIEYDASLETKPFYNSNRDGIVCPSKIYAQVLSNKILISFTKLSSIELTILNIDKVESESVQLTLSDSGSNGKSFKSDTSTSVKICEKVYTDISTESNGKTTSGQSSSGIVIVNGDTVTTELEFPRKVLTTKSEISASEFSNGCPDDIKMSCIGTMSSVDNTSIYSCTVSKKDGTESTNPAINGEVDLKEAAETISDLIEQRNIIKAQNIIGLDIDAGDVYIDCDGFSVLHTIYIMILILAPILVIVLGTIDYTKAVTTSDPQKMQKFKKRLPRRIIALVLLIMIPLIINGILTVLSDDLNGSLMYCITKGESDPIKLNSQNGNSSNNSNNSNITNNKSALENTCESECSNACRKSSDTSCTSSCKNTCITSYDDNCIDKATEASKSGCYSSFARSIATEFDSDNTTSYLTQTCEDICKSTCKNSSDSSCSGSCYNTCKNSYYGNCDTKRGSTKTECYDNYINGIVTEYDNDKSTSYLLTTCDNACASACSNKKGNEQTSCQSSCKTTCNTSYDDSCDSKTNKNKTQCFDDFASNYAKNYSN